jgi:hypothetical protein
VTLEEMRTVLTNVENPKYLELSQEDFDSLIPSYTQYSPFPVWTGALMFQGTLVVRRANGR